MDRCKLSNIIYNKRKEMGLSQKEFAQQSNTSRRTIEFCEDIECDDKFKPSVRELKRVSKFTNIEYSILYDLVYGK